MWREQVEGVTHLTLDDQEDWEIERLQELAIDSYLADNEDHTLAEETEDCACAAYLGHEAERYGTPEDLPDPRPGWLDGKYDL